MAAEFRKIMVQRTWGSWMVEIGWEEVRGKKAGPRRERFGEMAIKACMMDELGVRKSVKVGRRHRGK